MEYKYDVAFSFAGEDREYVEEVASIPSPTELANKILQKLGSPQVNSLSLKQNKK